MLAFGSARAVEPLVAYTGRTITDPAALASELERIRRRGFATAYEERELELNAIAAPVFDRGGSLAGIVALQGPIGGSGPRAGATGRRSAARGHTLDLACTR